MKYRDLESPDEFDEWLTSLAALPADGGDDVHCGFACGYVPPYGFVPEADCPIHDKAKP